MTTIEFPRDLKWGAATAAYQIEGAAKKDGRAPSIWDTFSHTPGNVKNGDHGDEACDSYHRYKEDVQYLNDLGVDVYRFSISWPRVMPKGTGELNPEGVKYYRNLIQELLDHDIEPIITLYHQAFREIVPDGEIGYAPNADWLEPYSQQQEDIDACERDMQWKIEWFMDPVFKGEYPQLLQDIFAQHNGYLNIEEGDMELISQPIDFMGINYYSGSVARYKEGNGLFEVEPIWVDYQKTDIGWPVYADGFYKLLTHLQQKYGDVPIYITENGACYNHEVEDGVVNDQERIDYLKQHLTALHRAIKSGVPIKGYILWSLLDNFEWAEGYSKRFGIIHVNYRTFERTKKESFYWYQKAVQNNWFEI